MLARFFTLLALTLVPTVAGANTYLVADSNDWFRYAERSDAGDTVTTRIELTEPGGWAMWSDFGGLGPTWVATESGNEWLWLWDGNAGVPLANLEGAVGTSLSIQHLSCNRGSVRIGSRLASLSTPAGTFTDVVRLSFSNGCSSSGTVSVWFAKGIGVVQWSQRSGSGLKTYRLTAAQIDGRNFPTNGPPPAASQQAVAPSEHAPMESILWGADDTYLVIDTYTDAFRGLHGSGATVEVFVHSQGVASQLRYELSQRNVPLDEVEFIVAPLNSVWMRDYGPIVLKDPSGRRVVADTDYYPDRPRDDRVPRAYASYRGWSRVNVNIEYEGGNFATDGNGLAMSSKGVLWFNSKSRSAIEREFEKLGCDRVVFFDPLKDEPTTHIDMFARVMTDDWALVSRYPSGHKQKRVCDDAATKLAGLGYQVKRVSVATSHDEFATYSNSVLANGRALVPQYGVPSRDQAALRAYRDLGFQVVPVNSRLIIQYSGVTHCLSMQVPAGN